MARASTSDKRPAQPAFRIGVLLTAVLVIISLLLGLYRVAFHGQAAAVAAAVPATFTRPALGPVPSPTAAPATALPIATDPTGSTILTSPAPSQLPTATARPSALPSASPTPTQLPVAAVAPTLDSLVDFLPNQLAAPTATPLAVPLPAPTGAISWTVRVPILMYHYIGYPPDPDDDLRRRLTVSPEAFRAQMAFLADNGFTPIDLYRLSLAITNQALLPEKPVLITLDDGYLDAYQYAFPILQEYGLTATFFIVTEFVDREHPAYMTWPMIEAMADAGMRMEPHTKTHPDLRQRDRAFLLYQILGSLQTLEAHIGYRPRFFAYPGGGFDDDVIAMLQELEFWGAVSTMGGKWHSYDNRFEWHRLRVRHDMPLAEFADLVTPDDERHGLDPGLLPQFLALLP